MNWTQEQKLAIDERDVNILVAAAAGSGKTAVLVERIKKLIIKDGVPIDRMLIVTFTNAAAAEMKEKIRKSIIAEIESSKGDTKLLREQLSLLPRASISTFHAFALDIIRNYFYLTDVEPGFSICDDAERTIIKEEAMDLLFESNFGENKKEFLDFLDSYSGDRNLNKIRNMVDSLYNSLQSMPEPFKTMEVFIKEIENGDLNRVLKLMWEITVDRLKEAVESSSKAIRILDDVNLDRLSTMVREELTAYTELYKASTEKDFEGVLERFENFPKVVLRARKDEKDDYDQNKDLIAALRKRASDIKKDLQEQFFAAPLEVQRDDIVKTYPVTKELGNLIEQFHALFMDGKKEKNLIDFSDIEHYCYEILKNENVAESCREKYKYIFVDEYQDTNLIQESIIGRIKGEKNLFMVGDIKQSIYKFRLAEPEIFKEKYKAYNDIKNEDSITIDLNKNYRSKSRILEEINKIFEKRMAGYDDKAKLYPGIDYSGEFNLVPEMHLVDLEGKDELSSELGKIKSAELEALLVGNIIESKIGKVFFDSKKGVEREIGFGDIVILMRSMKSYADTFYSVLKKKQIPVFVDDNEGYFDTVEIDVFMNLLSVIDNTYQDIPLLSVLHSEIFGFTADELGEIKICSDKTYFKEIINDYGANGLNCSLRDKVRAADEKIKNWKMLAQVMPLPDFMWKLMMDTDYYLIMGAMPGGTQRQGNLRSLIDKAEKFSEKGQVSLYSFMRYIDAVKKRKVTTGQAKLVGESEDIVRMMTIHKSKGLEFPMVIVSGIGRRLNYSKGGSGCCFDKDVGIALSLVDYKEHWSKQTLMQRIINRKIHIDEVSEEERILYVALTRAKDVLYMTGTVKAQEDFENKCHLGLTSDSTYLDMILRTTITKCTDCSYLVTYEEKPEKKEKNLCSDEIFLQDCDEETNKKVNSILNYKYPFEEKRGIKSKYTVSELNRKLEEAMNDVVLSKPKFSFDEESLTPAEKGNVYHGFMERMDFEKAALGGIEYISREADVYLKNGIFTEKEINAIDFEKLAAFFDTEIGKRCVESWKTGNLYREMPFNLVQEEEGEKIIVQGIIDCFFVTEEGIVLIDYKSNWINPKQSIESEKNRLRKMYEKQIEIYGEALSNFKNKKISEAYLYLFSRSIFVDMS